MRSKMMVAAVVAAMAALACGSAARGESAAVMLEKGIFAEESRGDVDGAMKIYQQIVQEEKASRPSVTQAMYRLGLCYLKKGDKAKAAGILDDLATRFADQEKLAAQARQKAVSIRDGMTEQDVAGTVKDAVLTISTCAETDPQVAQSLGTLQGLNSDSVVKAVAKYLDSDKDTVRRSAIYILWKGDFQSIAPAVPALTKLCLHNEDLTRGMAALALGGRKVQESYDTLAQMTLNDKSGFARRCAAYGLGLLGDERAKPILEKALKDSDGLVRNNAEAALTMLGRGTSARISAPRIIKTSPEAFASNVDPSLEKLSVTFDQAMKDNSWAWVRRYADKYPKIDGRPSYDKGLKTCTVSVKLEPGKVYWIEFNSPLFIGFYSQSGQAAVHQVLLFATADADGKPTPLPDDLVKQARRIIAAANPNPANAPRIVSMTPKCAASDVDPKTDKLSVTFDRKMENGSWAWVQRFADKYPKMTGRPSYDKGLKTCTVSVKLEPGKVYWIEFNSPPFIGFYSESGEAAVHQAMVFATAGANGKPTPIPEDLLIQAREINAARAEGPPRLPPEVMGYILGMHFKAYAVAQEKDLHVNTHIYGVDDQWNLYSGGLMMYKNSSGKPQAGPIRLGNFGTGKPDFLLTDEQGRRQDYDLREQPDARLGKWSVRWKPDKPVEPGAQRMLGYLSLETRQLPVEHGRAILRMQNHFGAPVLENFFLVVPRNMQIASSSEKLASEQDIGAYDIYLWQKQVPADTNNQVDVQLRKGPPSLAVSAAGRKEAEALAIEGWKLLKAVKFSEAEAKFKAAVASDESNADAWNGLGWARMHRGDPLDARGAFENCLQLDPKNAGALNGLAWIVKGQGNTDLAIKYWKQAVDASPNATAALSGLATTYMARDDYHQAAKYYRMWVKTEPGNTDAKTGLKNAVTADEATSAAVQAANTFLGLISDGKLDEAWDMLAKGNADRKRDKGDWKKGMAGTSERWGKLKSTKLHDAEYFDAPPDNKETPPGQRVTASVLVSYSHLDHPVSQTITLVKESDGHWRVSQHIIDEKAE